MNFISNQDKPTYFAGFAFFFALVFLFCCLSLLNQSFSLFTSHYDTLQSEKNTSNTSIFKKQLESGDISNIKLSHINQDVISIDFEYEYMEDIPQRKKKEDDSPTPQIKIEKTLSFIQKNNFIFENPHNIYIQEYKFDEYHKSRATPFAIIGAISFLLSAFFGYKREKSILSCYY